MSAGKFEDYTRVTKDFTVRGLTYFDAEEKFLNKMLKDFDVEQMLEDHGKVEVSVVTVTPCLSNYGFGNNPMWQEVDES